MNKKYFHFFDRDAINEITFTACYITQQIHPFKLFVFSILAGSFITFGALFSILLGSGISEIGFTRLLEGFGFSTGFFFVLISKSILFTEANVLMPTSLLQCRARVLIWNAIRVWITAFIGNFVGAYMVGILIDFTQYYPQNTGDFLQEIIDMKLQYGKIGTISAFIKVIISGSLANWLVGLAVIFATQNKTVAAKFIPIFLAVSVFVTANFQHAPANMGYFSLYIPFQDEVTWTHALLWNILPAGLGNILGGFVFVALPLWYTMYLEENVKPTKMHKHP